MLLYFINVHLPVIKCQDKAQVPFCLYGFACVARDCNNYSRKWGAGCSFCACCLSPCNTYCAFKAMVLLFELFRNKSVEEAGDRFPLFQGCCCNYFFHKKSSHKEKLIEYIIMTSLYDISNLLLEKPLSICLIRSTSRRVFLRQIYVRSWGKLWSNLSLNTNFRGQQEA